MALVLVVAACGGKTAEEEILEQIIENSGEDIGDVDIDTDDGTLSIDVEGEDGGEVNISTSGDDDEFNVTIEGEDGDGDVTITGTGDDQEMTITVEGEDGGTMTIGGGEVPETLTLPVPDGGNVVSSMEMEDGAMVILIYPLAAFDGLVAFYDDALPPGATKQEVNSGGQRSTSWLGDEFIVDVSTCEGLETNELDSACVTVNQFG
jgi:hypothetical protein